MASAASSGEDEAELIDFQNLAIGSDSSTVISHHNPPPPERFTPETITFDYNLGDIMSLSVGMFDPGRDKFELQTRPRPSIPFNKANLGRAFASDSLLFNVLPTEILTKVIKFLPAESLNILAVVSRDCRVFARTIQFETRVFDYVNLDLVYHLHREIFAIAQPRTDQLFLGPCIRRLRINTHAAVFNFRHDLDSESRSGQSDEEMPVPFQAALDSFFRDYLPLVCNIIRYALPNLELLEWSDHTRLSGSAWKAILRSPVRHLKLFRVSVNCKTLNEVRALSQAAGASIETLEVELSRDIDTIGKSDEAERTTCYDFTIELLNRCASRLKTLVWSGGFNRGSGTQKPANSCIWQSSDLCHSNTSTAANDFVVNHISHLGNLPALKGFVWRQFVHTPALPIKFLEQNPQLELLSLDNCPGDFLNDLVLPLLASDFTRLTSLELIYDEHCTILSKTALSYISQLKTLVQLHLQLGHQLGWRRTWVVKHRDIRDCVQQLPNLKILALSRDTYDPENSGDSEEYERYYEGWDAYPTDHTEWRLQERHRDDDGDPEARTKFFFEMSHRRRVLQHAYRYVNTFWYKYGPMLDFIYFGEIPMRVRLGYYGYRPIAISERRDDLWTFLHRKFQKEDDSFGSI
ncbi:uncharacterized protein AB675_6240 [Cyphellophora attinorum]|uniref:F-box domain-containing protein n=1 Tax=Cyphellophora attinorum TaxID=1664694 RepID=A0A0N0NQI5_9EURO|nr:uncharacterized protein AB675_6240 [Phialophora attinorum]KPI43948.1 hypothetical protein AB675_6240 [Phialophora attinorum]